MPAISLSLYTILSQTPPFLSDFLSLSHSLSVSLRPCPFLSLSRLQQKINTAELCTRKAKYKQCQIQPPIGDALQVPVDNTHRQHKTSDTAFGPGARTTTTIGHPAQCHSDTCMTRSNWHPSQTAGTNPDRQVQLDCKCAYGTTTTDRIES